MVWTASRRLLRRLWRRTGWRAVGVLVALHVVVVGSVRFINPPFTLTMVGAALEHRGLPERSWTDLDELGHLPRMAVAGEDAAFWMHSGFDWVAVCSAIDENRKARARGSTRKVGGSTIPQQVVRNVFLWQGRSWLRKGLETWLTPWLMALVPRERILELYLNIAQTGPRTFGMEAGAQRAFGRSAASLSAREAARLIALLPAPSTWTVHDTRVVDQGRRIERNRDPWPGEPYFDEVASAWEKRNPGPVGCAWRQLRR